MHLSAGLALCGAGDPEHAVKQTVGLVIALGVSTWASPCSSRSRDGGAPISGLLGVPGSGLVGPWTGRCDFVGGGLLMGVEQDGWSVQAAKGILSNYNANILSLVQFQTTTVIIRADSKGGRTDGSARRGGKKGSGVVGILGGPQQGATVSLLGGRLKTRRAFRIALNEPA